MSVLYPIQYIRILNESLTLKYNSILCYIAMIHASKINLSYFQPYCVFSYSIYFSKLGDGNKSIF